MRSNRPAAEPAAPLALVSGRRPGRSRNGSGSGCQGGAARTPGRDAPLGMIGDGTAPSAAHPRQHAGPAPQPLWIGTAAADLPRVPAAAAGRTGKPRIRLSLRIFRTWSRGLVRN